eukprot:CAMPEP_0172321614 /NCGR_PEP_ID=MMETSP1058-20130122/43834_1 /TAXON_ID=83371 /ORGANISM="Detonula confervacea, Strain CCMP 353" /LENGTH=500 /DNA_ID=CAMNT_0013037169 /DNA_START=166 /DNA_END=1665 /DNA_ORIENTATION=+
MHRRTAATTPSSKVAASRERRARRGGNKSNNGGGVRNVNGHLPHHSKHYSNEKGMGLGKRITLLTIGLTFVCILLIWGAGNSDSRISPKNAIRRMRKGKSNYQSPREKTQPESILPQTSDVTNQNPYTVEALDKNPHLGWQPPLVPSPLGSSFSWRTCFKADPTSDGSDQPAGCNENPSELGKAPAVEKDWVPDVTMVRTMMMYGKDRDGNPFPPPLSKELCEDIAVRGGKQGDSNKECVRESMIRRTGALNSTTVTISPSNHYEAKSNGDTDSIVVPAPKIMCLVYTMADAHANRIRAMRETWAGGCDGFLAFSTESDPRLPAISLEHEGPEAYENMWQKVRSIWKFVGTHYLEDYDWFFIGGDDLYVLPHNLKTYLASLIHKDGTDPKSKEYFVGRRFNSGGGLFNSGGAGYSLSQATLRKFLAAMDDAKHCSADKRTSMEDVMIARCLSHLGIYFTDTRDAKGRERFHPFAPGSHLHWTPPGPGQQRDWYEDYNKDW